jgi:hypothetical protein
MAFGAVPLVISAAVFVAFAIAFGWVMFGPAPAAT